MFSKSVEQQISPSCIRNVPIRGILLLDQSVAMLYLFEFKSDTTVKLLLLGSDP